MHIVTIILGVMNLNPVTSLTNESESIPSSDVGGGAMQTTRVVVDFDKCTGHGRCYSEAEELLPYDDEGFVQARHGALEINADQIPLARSAAAACPEGAMTIVTED